MEEWLIQYFIHHLYSSLSSYHPPPSSSINTHFIISPSPLIISSPPLPPLLIHFPLISISSLITSSMPLLSPSSPSPLIISSPPLPPYNPFPSHLYLFSHHLFPTSPLPLFFLSLPSSSSSSLTSFSSSLFALGW